MIVVPKNAVDEAKKILEEAIEEARKSTLSGGGWEDPSLVTTIFRLKAEESPGKKKFKFFIVEEYRKPDLEEVIKTMEDIWRKELGEYEIIYVRKIPDRVVDPEAGSKADPHVPIIPIAVAVTSLGYLIYEKIKDRFKRRV